MNFNIYLNDSLVKEIEAMVVNTGKKRNTIIQEAVRDFIDRHHKKQWSRSIKDFSGINELREWEGF